MIDTNLDSKIPSKDAMNAEPVHEYHADWRMLRERLPWLIGALVFAVVLVAIVGEADIFPLFLLIFGAIALLALALGAWLFRYTRYFVSADGIWYRAAGMSVFSSWANLARIDSQIMYGDGQVEGLRLKHEGLEMNPFLKYSSYLSLSGYLTMKGYRDFIPLSSLLGKDWRDKPIGEDIRRYAPHLFEQPASDWSGGEFRLN